MQAPGLSRPLRTLSRVALILAMIFIARMAIAQDSNPPKEQSPSEPPRSAPVAERILISFTSAAGDTARSTVLFRFDPGKPQAPAAPDAQSVPASPRLRLTLSRLEILITPGRLVATYRGEDSTYYEAALPQVLTPESIRAALPPLPLPQIERCFGTASQRLNSHPYGLETTLETTQADGTRHFSAQDGALSDHPPARGVRPRRIELRANDGSLLRLDITPMGSSSPESWDLQVDGRVRVPALADLRTRPEPTLEGQEFRDVGFTAPDLSSVALKDLAGAESPRASVLIVFDAGADGAPVEAARASLAVARAAVLAAVTPPDTRGAPIDASRVNLYLVRSLPLAALDIPGLATTAQSLLNDPSVHGGPGTRVLNTTSGAWLLGDQLGGTSIAAVVLNAQRTILLAKPLEGLEDDADGLAVEIRRAVQRALGVKDPEPPGANPPAPK